jgi:hypothetical protein
VIAGADWVVELGPEGGDGGGKKVAEGSVAQVARRKTATGKVLRELLEAGRRGAPRKQAPAPSRTRGSGRRSATPAE